MNFRITTTEQEAASQLGNADVARRGRQVERVVRRRGGRVVAVPDDKERACAVAQESRYPNAGAIAVFVGDDVRRRREQVAW